MALCGVLALAGGPTASWAGPALSQCNGIKDLVFVPHQDDDLLFMNPDIKSAIDAGGCVQRSEEHTSELQSLMRISYAVFCLKKKKTKTYNNAIALSYQINNYKAI